LNNCIDSRLESVPPAPSSSAKDAAEQSGHANGGPKQDGNTLLDCVNCKRPIASNRYAPHLASCMGLSVGARRGGPRNASKRFDSEGARSASPQISLEGDSLPSHIARNAIKRPNSPSEASIRETKRAKSNSGKSTPVPRNNGSQISLNGTYDSIPRESSKLRSSPVVSQENRPSPVQSERQGSDSDATASGQQSSLSAGSNSQPLSGDLVEPFDIEEKDPDYVDIDGQVDTESSDSDSEG